MHVEDKAVQWLGAVSSNEQTPRWLLIAVAALVFVFPIVVATTDGGGSYVYTLLLLPALFLGRGWRAMQPWERHLLLGLVVALLAMALSFVNSEDLRQGVKWLERYLRIALIIPIYLMFRRFGFTLGQALGAGAAIAALVMAGQAWYQVAWQGQGLASGFYHKIVFGDLAVLWGSLAVVFAMTLVRGWKGGILAGVAAAAALYASVLSHTRGAWLFVPVFLIVLLWVYRRQIFSSRQAVVVSLAVLVVVVAAGVWQSKRIGEGIAHGANDIRVFMQDPSAGTSWGIRLNLWRNTLLLAEEHPLLGTGLGDFHQEMRDMAADGRSWSPAVADFGHAHSIYFDTLGNAGLIGMSATVIAYLLLPLLAFMRGLGAAGTPEARFYALGGIVTVLAFAVFGLSEALWARNPFVNTYVVCLAVLLAGMVNCRKGTE